MDLRNGPAKCSGRVPGKGTSKCKHPGLSWNKLNVFEDEHSSGKERKFASYRRASQGQITVSLLLDFSCNLRGSQWRGLCMEAR